ncbi:MAG: YheC/YheD family protein [Bacillota bacterium]
MERHVVLVTADTGAKAGRVTVSAPFSLLSWLDLRDGESRFLGFGLAEEHVIWERDDSLGESELRVGGRLARWLPLQTPLNLTLFRRSPQHLSLGPLVGLLISAPKLEAVLNGRIDHVYCRYAQAAREAGAVLLFCAAGGFDLTRNTVDGYLHHCDGAGPCRWVPLRTPLPRVLYDRSFGKEARAAATDLRRALEPLGAAVVNRPVKITKLQAFEALQPPGELAPHLPRTVPFTPEFLAEMAERCDDLYLKPDALYKGKGVCRLKRSGAGWEIHSRAEWGNQVRLVGEQAELAGAVAELLDPEARYVVQEGLPLATYLGNRFDLRSLVQRDGRGEWRVTGVVARVAPAGSAITSPRSGGQVAPLDAALRHAFGDRAEEVRAEIERVSLALAERVDQRVGPCAELGLDLGVLVDGTVKLIEVNGIPLRVSLERLKDPLVGERIDRFPIHFGAYLDMQG